MTIKQAIINYINARADRLRPCKHKWEVYDEKTAYFKKHKERNQ